jgi:hypothetical protein
MMLRKPVIVSTAFSLALTAYGVGNDVGASDGTGDYTVSHAVPAGTSATVYVAVYVINTLTGEEVRVPPQDRDHAAHFAPAKAPAALPGGWTEIRLSRMARSA